MGTCLGQYGTRWIYKQVSRLAALGIKPRTPGLCSQCSTTELRPPDNHQPSQSSIYTAQVVLKCLSLTPGSHSAWLNINLSKAIIGPPSKTSPLPFLERSCRLYKLHIFKIYITTPQNIPALIFEELVKFIAHGHIFRDYSTSLAPVIHRKPTP